MTAPMKKTAPSVDYTSRDYAALRTELIARMQDRVPEWTGNDPADFGLALIEAFAYMGDMTNYYVDRIANESYILTATQRQSLLNLASMYGYYPKGYVASTVNGTFTSTYGYKGQLGGSIIQNGVASVIGPTDLSANIAVGDSVKILGRTNVAYNGTWTVDSIGVVSGLTGSSATNTFSFTPTFTITGYSTSGNDVIFTCDNSFVTGQQVAITGISTSNSTTTGKLNATFTIVSATATTFRVTVSGGPGSGAYTSGGTVKFTNISLESDISGYVSQVGYTTIPAGSQVSTDVSYQDTIQKVTFTVSEDVLVPYNETASALLVQGEDVSYRQENLANPAVIGDINGELIGTSDGSINQYFPISEDRVDVSTIKVYVESTNVYVLWKQVDHLSDWDSSATVYTVVTDSEGTIFIVFGDNVTGAVPSQDSKIKVQYVYGGGEVGNVDANSLSEAWKSSSKFPSLTSDKALVIRSNIALSHDAAIGGADPESDDSIRYNAPRTLRAMNRAVTLRDFADLALTQSGVGKAIANADIWSAVTVYVAPTLSESSQTSQPTISDSTLTQVKDFLTSKSQIGTTVTVLGPSYTPVKIAIDYTVDPAYIDSQVRQSIYSTLISTLSYNNIDFGATFSAKDIEYIVRNVAGVSNATVTKLYRDGGDGLNVLTAEVNELFSFSQGNISLSVANSVSTLSDLTLSGVTLSPVFSSDVLTYGGSTTGSSLDVTATATQSSASISINNNAAVSGVAKSVNLVTGTNVVKVVVTAADGTSTTYKVILTVA